MANLSNINNYFVVDTAGQIAIGDVSSATLPTLQTQLTVYDHTGTAGVIIQSGGASGKKYELFSNASGTFGISDIGVGDRLTISSGGDATFAGTITSTSTSTNTLAGKLRINGTTTTGLEIASSSGSSSGLKLYNDSSNDHAYILNHYNGNLVLGTNNAAVITLNGTTVTVGNATYGSSLGQVRIINDAASNPASLSLMGYNNVADGGNYASIDLAMQSSGTGGQVVASIRGLAEGTGENASDLAFYTATGGTLAERMRIESTGVVKFPNTATSTGDVGTIAHYTNNYMYVRGGTGGLAIGDDGFGVSIYLNNSDSIQFNTGGTEKMRITSGGEVGIGTNFVSAKLQVHSTNAGQPTIPLFIVNESTTIGTEARLGFAANTNNNVGTNRYSYISTINTSGSNGQDMIFATNETGASAVERMRIDAKGLVKEIYNGATTTTSNYVRGTTYSWNGSSLSFYWNKIGNVNSSAGSCKLVVEVLGFGDNNYPYWQRGIIKVGKYSTGLNISVIRTEGFGGDLIGFDAVVDSNFDVWVKMNNLSWSSYIGFKLLNAEGGATLNTDPISSATLTTPTGGTPVVSADRSIRVNTGALGTITHSYQDFYTKIGGSNVFLLGPNQNTSFNITNIGNTSPTNPAQLNVKTPGSALVETGLRLINPYGFGSTGCGVKIAFAQDRSNGENYEMAAIESRQAVGGTSALGDLSFYTRNNSALAERLRIQASGQSNFYGSIWATGYYITALQGNSQLTNASTSSGSLASYIGQGLISVSISDAKAKENFSDVQTNECLNKIVSLADHVKKFDWIDEDWKKQKGRTVGMVAQEIYEDHSEFVHKPENYDDDGWAIRYQEIVPTLIKSIQELKADNDSLKARIETLENN